MCFSPSVPDVFSELSRIGCDWQLAQQQRTSPCLCHMWPLDFSVLRYLWRMLALELNIFVFKPDVVMWELHLCCLYIIKHQIPQNVGTPSKPFYLHPCLINLNIFHRFIHWLMTMWNPPEFPFMLCWSCILCDAKKVFPLQFCLINQCKQQLKNHLILVILLLCMRVALRL